MTTLFDYDLWLVVVPLVGVGVLLAYLAGARTLPTYALTLYALVLAGLVWVLWSFTELELPFVQDEGVNPIVRLSASLVVASAALLPLLLDAAWRGSTAGGGGVVRRVVPWLVVAARRARVSGRDARARRAELPDARRVRRDRRRPTATSTRSSATSTARAKPSSVRDQALEVGFIGTEMEWNGCGRVRVAVGGIPTLAVGHEFADEARGVGFDVTLEQAAG